MSSSFVHVSVGWTVGEEKGRGWNCNGELAK